MPLSSFWFTNFIAAKEHKEHRDIFCVLCVPLRLIRRRRCWFGLLNKEARKPGKYNYSWFHGFLINWPMAVLVLAD
jgi:hypothetical protein